MSQNHHFFSLLILKGLTLAFFMNIKSTTFQFLVNVEPQDYYNEMIVIS